MNSNIYSTAVSAYDSTNIFNPVPQANTFRRHFSVYSQLLLEPSTAKHYLSVIRFL